MFRTLICRKLLMMDRICTIYCFTTATVVTRTHLTHITSLVCIYIYDCSRSQLSVLSPNAFLCTGVLISPYPDQERNKLKFLSEWHEFPSAPCLAGGEKKLDDSSRLDAVEIARVADMLPSLFPSWSG